MNVLQCVYNIDNLHITPMEQVSKEIAFAKVKKRKLFFIRRIKKINFPFLPEIVVIYIRHI